jgi:hypothetical protein
VWQLDSRPEAKNTEDGAISSGWAARPAGACWPNPATRSSPKVAGIRGVHTGPGAAQLTRIPRSRSDWASEQVEARITPLVAA